MSRALRVPQAQPGAPACARRSRRRLPRGADAVLAAAVGLELVVLALLPRVVTTDGPAHLLGGAVLAQPGDAFLSRFYLVDWTPVPNMLTTVLLAGLLRVSGADAAEKLLVAGYLVLLPLALRYALRGVDPRAGWLALLALPFSTGYLFLYGFYNFCTGIALALLVVGLALRRRDGWTAPAAVALSALVLLTWTTHLLPALVGGGVVAALAVARAVADDGPRLAAVRRHVLPPALAGVPALLLTLAFAASDAAQRGAPEHVPWWQLAFGLLTLSQPLVAYSAWEIAPASVLAGLLLALAVRARRAHRASPARRSPERTALAVATLAATVAFLASPQRYGSEYGFLNDRLSLFPPLLLLLWAAGPPPARAALRRGAVAVALAASAAFPLLRLPTELGYQRDVAELMSVAPSVPPRSLLLKVQLWRDPPSEGRVRNPFRDALRHSLGRLAVVTGGVDAGHYEAVQAYFPVRFRPDADPRSAVDPSGEGLWAVPSDVHLAAPRGPAPDVVLVLGRRRAAPGALASPTAVRVLGELAQHYRQVAVSRRTGLVEVWVRQG